jgi:uncharacterized protein YjbJ (UPF0337 family)
MTRLQDKAQAHTKQIVGQMIGDDKLVLEGKEDERKAEQGEKKEARDRPVGNRQRQ